MEISPVLCNLKRWRPVVADMNYEYVIVNKVETAINNITC